MNKKLAKISKATLEIKERGILNFWIYVDYEDFGCQGIGGIVLDKFDKEKDRRAGTAYGCEMIRQILITMNVNDFSEMKGKHIWVYGEGNGFGFSPKGIQPLSVDRKTDTLIFSDVAKQYRKDEL